MNPRSSDAAHSAGTSSKKRTTTTSSGTKSSGAKRTSSRSSSPKTRKAGTSSSSTDYLSPEQREALRPFFELFADVDSVFDCDDAMDPEKRQMGFARVYRAWKSARAQLDPDFNPHRRIRR